MGGIFFLYKVAHYNDYWYGDMVGFYVYPDYGGFKLFDLA